MPVKQPATLIEAIRVYDDPDVAEACMASKRWPNGVACPHCGATKVYRLEKQRRWKCSEKHPGRQFSVKTGTIMEDSPIPLNKWLIATWLLVNAKNGISSHEVHRSLGITQKSAWFVLHRLRYALKIVSMEKLTGTIEADEMHHGGSTGNYSQGKKKALHAQAKKLKPGKPVHLSRVAKKSIVMGMLERGQKGQPSQMRTAPIQSVRRPHISEIIKAHVEPGAFLMTDSLSAYKHLGEAGYIHMAVNHAIRYAEGRIHTNGVENFWSLLARTLQGTYVAVEPIHLNAYLDEQCWRFNHRKMTDGERMIRVLPGTVGKRLTYKELTGKVESPLVS